MKRAGKCLNIADLQRRAQARLPAPLYDYLEGGADDEKTLGANVASFSRYNLVANCLRDIRDISLSRNVLGRRMDWPLILAPTGMSRLFHKDGELAVAREAARAGIAYSLSTMATTSIEDAAAQAAGPRIFQLYLFNDGGLNRAMIDRCREAGFDALCLTVDCVIPGNRERDIRNGLTVPPRLTLSSVGKFARRPAWCLDYVLGESFSLPNVGDGRGNSDLSSLAAYFAEKMETNITWRMVEEIAAYWGGPLAIKGLQTPHDARLAVGAGASAVVVSNHGGRQLDCVPATIDLLPAIADAIGGRAEVILDGGIRRGSDMVKALALGATACMAGRPYLYGLAAFGQPGVRRTLDILKSELQRCCQLMGCASVDELNHASLRLATDLPQLADGQEGEKRSPSLSAIRQTTDPGMTLA